MPLTTLESPPSAHAANDAVRLTLQDLMVSEVVTASPELSTGEVLQRMRERRISCVIVVEGRTPIGIFTERDAVRLLALGHGHSEFPVRDFMSTPVVTVRAEIDFQQAYQTLNEGGFRHLVVVDSRGDLAGLVSETDFLHYTGVLVQSRTVGSVMNRHVLTLEPARPLVDAVHLLSGHDIGSVVVVEAGRPCGILTERDMVSFSARKLDLETPVAQVMSHPLQTVSVDTSLQEAGQLMREGGMRRLVVVDDEGRLVGILTRRDIVKALEGRYVNLLKETIERQQAALAEAHDQLHVAERQLLYLSLMDQVTDSVMVAEVETGRIIAANAQAWQTRGYSREEFLALTVDQISSHVGAAENWGRYAQQLVRKGRLTKEALHRRKDGTTFPAEVSIRHVRSEGRDLLVAVARDITERKQAERALLERETQLRALIEALPDAVFFKDGEGGWQVVNSRALELFQMRDKPWHGRTDRQLARLNPSMADAFLACIDSDESAWRNGRVTHSAEVVAEGALQRHFEVTKIPLFHGDGQRHGLVVVGHEVTAQREAEQRLRASEESYRGLFDSVTEAIYIQDEEGRFLDVNPAAEAMYGYRREDLIGRTPEFLSPHGQNDLAHVAERVRAAFHGVPQRFEFWGRRRNGEVFLKEISVTPGTYFGQAAVIAVARDMTERRRAEETLRQAAAVYESTAEGVVITDAEFRIVAVNKAFTSITGYTEAEVRGRHPRIFGGKRDEALFPKLRQHLQASGSWQGEVWNRRKNGEAFPEWLTLSAVRDELGGVSNYVGVFSDISLIKNSEAQLEHLAHYDPLTDLPNRLLMQSRLGHALDRARRSGRQVAVLFLDLDRFKNINDSLGHPAGDELLMGIARRLRQRVREEDTVARQGGDEFIVVLESLERREEAAQVAQDVIELLRQPFQLAGGHEVYTGASVGISLFPGDGDEPTQLVSNADAAMYQAKEAGGNTYRYYTGALTRAAHARLSMETRLRRALERDEFVLHFQPQVDLASGRVTGAEALVRWRSAEEGLIPPARFIPAAEETGLIVPLGHWVMDAACAAARRWLDQGLPPISLAINVSTRQFRENNPVGALSAALESSRLDPAQVEIEITESTIMEYGAQSTGALRRIKELGVSLAIDDFGTGYSSLAALKRLVVDKLKIDRSFVQEIPQDRSDMEIAATIIAMARTLGLKVLAEGVETEAQFGFLRLQGCHEAQGYFWSRPIPEEEFSHWLRDRAPVERD